MLTWREMAELIQEIRKQAAERFSYEAVNQDLYATDYPAFTNCLFASQENAQHLARLSPPSDDSLRVRAIIHKNQWIVEQFLPDGEPPEGYRLSHWCCVLKLGVEGDLLERKWLRQRDRKGGASYELPDQPPYMIEVGKDYVDTQVGSSAYADRIRRRWYGVVVGISANIARIEDFASDRHGAMARAAELAKTSSRSVSRKVIATG